MIELSRAQDEEVGDGTTSVIILAGLRRNPFLRRLLSQTFRRALHLLHSNLIFTPLR
jgi:chaperonin GroEL (HSP60 family)